MDPSLMVLPEIITIYPRTYRSGDLGGQNPRVIDRLSNIFSWTVLRRCLGSGIALPEVTVYILFFYYDCCANSLKNGAGIGQQHSGRNLFLCKKKTGSLRRGELLHGRQH